MVSRRSLPILLIVLDGLGDRQHPELGGLTPLEAAATPALDALASAGSCGLMWPLGPGRAPTSPLAHYVLFGYPAESFPGRGLIEAAGEGMAPDPGKLVFRANFVRAEDRDGILWVTERPDPRIGEPANADVDLGGEIGGVFTKFKHTGGAQGLLFMRSHDRTPLSAEVTDADPLRADAAIREVVPFAEAADPEAAARTARTLNAWMRETRMRLAGRALDTAVVKWPASGSARCASFEERTGLRGATFATGTLYRGLASYIGMDVAEMPTAGAPGENLAYGLERALELLGNGTYEFAHVHTKQPDEAGHHKNPERKREVIELLDRALAPHLDRLLAGDLVVCITADHQTPSSGPLYHSGGAVPLLIVGGAAGRDGVAEYAERACRAGALGTINGAGLMPLMLDCADRSAFLGAERYTAEPCLGTASGSTVQALRSDGEVPS